MRHGILIAGLLTAVLLGGAAGAKEMVLATDERLADSGLLDYLVPRFALKTGVRVTVTPHDAAALTAADGDALLLPSDLAESLAASGEVERRKAALHSGEDESFDVVLVPDAANSDHARTFHDWLTGEIGQRTIAAFEGPVKYEPGAIRRAAAPAPMPEGDADAGEMLALLHCGRCHVVSQKNRFSGIGSTPSFAALRGMTGWQDKFLTFWALNPHPSFTQVEGLTEPFDPARPPHIAPVEMTQEEMEAVAAFVGTITPIDLGAEIDMR